MNVNDLLKDAESQLIGLTGGRLENQKLYIELLKDIDYPEVTLAQLLEASSLLKVDKYVKADLLKLIEVNFRHIQNKDEVTRLMKNFGVENFPFKPLSESIGPKT